MKANQAEFSIRAMCRALDVSASGYYAWRSRGPCPRAQGDAALSKRVKAIHEDSDGTYGVPRIHAELKEEQVKVGAKRLARLMKEQGIRGVCRRRSWKTTVRDERERPAQDLVERDFSAQAPNQLWVADITYVPTWSGFLFLAVVLDVFSRRIVGWAMATHIRAELVLEALEMALSTRRPTDGVIHHSDQGSQYTSLAFGKRCEQHGISPSGLAPVTWIPDPLGVMQY
jgi:putative transposase